MTDIQPGPPSAESLREQIAADVRAALKARDVTTLSVLRTLLGAIDNASAIPETGDHVSTVGRASDLARRHVSRDDMVRVLRAESASRAAAASDYDRAGRAEEALRLRREIELIARYVDAPSG